MRTPGLAFRIAFTAVEAFAAIPSRGGAHTRSAFFYTAVLSAGTIVYLYLAGYGIADAYFIAMTSAGPAFLSRCKGQERQK